MIRVERSAASAPSVLSGKRALAEKKRAEEFFSTLQRQVEAAKARPAANGRPLAAARLAKGKRRKRTNASANPVTEKKKFTFAVYRDDEIKVRLNQLFRGKCAYCESRYAA